MKIKVALIGISGYGRVHFNQMRQLVECGLAEIAAAVVINPDQVQNELAVLREMGTAVYSSTDAMFADFSGKLDLVCIPTGIAFHEPMTVQALSNGANVLVEKPAAGSTVAIRRMMEAERKSGKFVAVGFQHMYAREIQFIKRYLMTGRLGKVKKIVCKGLWPRDDQYYGRNNWAGKIAAADGTPILDSPINNAFAHYLNIQLFLAGETFGNSAHAVAVEGELYRARRTIETFDTCALRFTTENDVLLQIMLTHTVARNGSPTIRVECENGTVYWKVDDSWNICAADGSLLYSGVVEAPHKDMFMDMVRRITGEQTFRCSLSMALEHTHCIELMTGKLTPRELTGSVTRLEPNGQYVLDRVEEVFDEGYRRGLLPSELGVEWK
ncbi:MAG: Gfo/Idh/MocA family oxidoreductase [Victivallales bacterium]